MRADIQFKEVVRSPAPVIIKQFLFFALLLAAAVPIVFKLMMTGQQTAPWPTVIRNYVSHPPLLLLVPMWAALAVGILLINRVCVVVKNNVLHLPPESRYKARDIPLADIVICRRMEFQPSLVAQFGPGKNSGNYLDQTVPLPGYHGPGLQVGFRRARPTVKNLLSLASLDSEPKDAVTVRVLFPCRNADQLLQVIRSTQQREDQ